MPIRKVGSDTPSSDSVIISWAPNLPRRSAAYTPSGMPTGQRDDGRTERQFQRRREALGDQRRHLAALAQAEAELALHRIADEAAELHDEGLVEPEVAAQLVALLLRGVLAQQVGDRVADVLEQHEGDEGHREHHDDGLGQPAKNENEHRCSRAVMPPQQKLRMIRNKRAVRKGERPERSGLRTLPARRAG